MFLHPATEKEDVQEKVKGPHYGSIKFYQKMEIPIVQPWFLINQFYPPMD